MILAFGELMMRVAPPGHLRFRQAMPGSVEITFAGAEANVCVALAQLGVATRLVTALPENPVADAALATLRGVGVDVSHVRRAAGRLGIYFVETGANQRGSVVVYDRDHSAISLAGPGAYDFAAALEGVHWVHVTGITPSLSEPAFQATGALLAEARGRGLTISCDLNFRKKLWRWRPGQAPRELARDCMTQLLPAVDVLIANEEDASDVLDIHAAGSDVEQGRLDTGGYESVARQIAARFRNLRQVAITLRQSRSADHNDWGALLYDVASDRALLAPLDADGNYRPYEIRDIVDRVGAGDSFGAGLIFAQQSDEFREPHTALRLAVAASCLKHSILGDFNFVTLDEVVSLMGGSASGRVRR